MLLATAAPVASSAVCPLLCRDGLSPPPSLSAAATWPPALRAQMIAVLHASPSCVYEWCLPAGSPFALAALSCFSDKTGESASRNMQCIRGACICSCSTCIVVLTSTDLCCAALLQPQITVWPHPTPSLLCPCTNSVQFTAPSTTHCREAPLAALANRAQQSRHLPRSSLQPTSAASHHPGQLRFREELMHELLAQLPPDQQPQRASARPNPAESLAKDHYSEHSSTCRACVTCSDRVAGKRTETRYVCHACGVHLCIGACFSSYHDSMQA